MKSIQSKDLDLNKKKVLIRLDLNVPISGTKIIAKKIAANAEDNAAIEEMLNKQ